MFVCVHLLTSYKHTLIFLFITLLHLLIKFKQSTQNSASFALKIAVHRRSTVLIVNCVGCVVLPVR
jgi:hypothetical protein